MSGTYDVLDYSAENLFLSLSNPLISAAQVGSLAKAKYLHGYLQAIGVRSIVVEHDYTDGDFLDDFASYYVRCHASYSRRCKRLHFFSHSVTADQLKAAVRAESPDAERCLTETYLGFIVARPLPEAIIGRTILKTYDDDNGRRNYTCVRAYYANLFGIPLSLESLAYQEQDTVIAACATVALWCAFHKTSDLFATTLPKLKRITDVGNQAVYHARPIPSHGLSIHQICNVIRTVELEPEIIVVQDDVPLASLIYGHLRMGLPVILGAEIESTGLHALTIAGYSLSPVRTQASEVGPNAKTGVPLVGLRINEFYAHDDQIGPFSRLAVRPSKTVAGQTFPICFDGSWVNAQGTALGLHPLIVIVPIYHKVRVTWIDVHIWLTRFNIVANTLLGLPASQQAAQSPTEWDLHLVTLNQYKAELRQSADIARNVVEQFAFASHPRFIWRALLTNKGNPTIEILADATDMAKSFPLYHVIWHSDAFRKGFIQLSQAPKIRPILVNMLTEKFVDFLCQQAGSP